MTEETQPKKKRINSKAKGNAGERAIANILNTALAPFVFKRIQSSGAVLGGKNSINLDDYTSAAKCAFVGDVFCSNDEKNTFRFCIESKHYKDIDTLEHLFNNSNIYKWLDEVNVDAVKIDKDGIVIFKFNRSPYYAAVSKDLDFPAGIKHIVLPNGSKVCHLDILLTLFDFWFKS
jgi:hypothetical protein